MAVFWTGRCKRHPDTRGFAGISRRTAFSCVSNTGSTLYHLEHPLVCQSLLLRVVLPKTTTRTSSLVCLVMVDDRAMDYEEFLVFLYSNTSRRSRDWQKRQP